MPALSAHSTVHHYLADFVPAHSAFCALSNIAQRASGSGEERLAISPKCVIKHVLSPILQELLCVASIWRFLARYQLYDDYIVVVQSACCQKGRNCGTQE